MHPPDTKSSCGTQNTISNTMGIGLGIVYVTWRTIQIWIPPTSNLHVGHNINFQSNRHTISKNGSPAYEILMRGTEQTKNETWNPVSVGSGFDYVT